MTLYRMDATQFTDSTRLNMVSYDVIKETPKGYWIDIWPKKWVSKNGKKRFAYPTQEEAKISFIKRRERQVTILSNQLKNAKLELEMAKTGTSFESKIGSNVLLA